MTVGEKLREIRHRRGWKVDKLSKKSGIHFSAIWQYENGNREPGVKNLLILVKALGASLQEFDKCDGIPTPPPPKPVKPPKPEKEIDPIYKLGIDFERLQSRMPEGPVGI